MINFFTRQNLWYVVGLSLASANTTALSVETNNLEPSLAIGQTTALIAEAGLPNGPLRDGVSGNTNFPYARFKALATIGEKDLANGLALTGYPDGHAAWLHDEKTIRLAYQSESYATMGKAPEPETYPWVMRNGVTFTGSHIHWIDFDREGFASFMSHQEPASLMVKGSGKLFDRIYNIFGEEVTVPTFDPKNLAGKWGNQTRPDGTLIPFKPSYQLSEADYFFQSFCGAWYEPAYQYGEGIGFSDDIWLAAEEWDIGRMFPAGSADSAATMGLASVVVDVARQTAYVAPALGQTGYEKIMPLNPGHKDYVVIATSGYNHGQEPSPLKVYVGMKHRDADGSVIDYKKANQRDRFLARNGLLYGKLYGMAVTLETASNLVSKPDAKHRMLDDYVTDANAPKDFQATFFPTSFQWQGWDKPVAVQDTEMMLWQKSDEQPKGHVYFNGDSKVEHVAGDPDGAPRYFANLTNKGALLAIDFGEFAFDGVDLPADIPAKIRRSVPAVDGALTLNIGAQGKTVNGDASIHMEKSVAKMVAPDGLYWVKSSEGQYLIVDEDSGNDFGERKYVLTIDDSMNVISGHLLALAGGKHSARYQAGVSALGGAFTKPGSSEFSGSWPVTALIQRKDDGSFYTIEELKGEGRRNLRRQIPTHEQTFIGVVQARSESSGAVARNKADAGGQIFMFTMNPTD